MLTFSPEQLSRTAEPSCPPHYSAFSELPHIQAAFFTARGSKSPFGLDCSVSRTTNFAEKISNRVAVARAFGVESCNLLTTKQETPTVMTVLSPWALGNRPRDNALVMCDRRQHVIGVLTNDCAPVLMADKNKPIIAAAHIGWREAAQNVLEQTIESMQRQGSSREHISVEIGPCAGIGNSYAVSSDFADLPPNRDKDIADFMVQAEGQIYFRLQAYVRHRLIKAAIEVNNIRALPVDTIVDTGCYSYRRNGPGGGMMFSGIKLRELTVAAGA